MEDTHLLFSADLSRFYLYGSASAVLSRNHMDCLCATTLPLLEYSAIAENSIASQSSFHIAKYQT